MLSSLDMDNASTVGRIRAKVVQDKDELLRNVARSTALLSACLDKIDGALYVRGKSDTENTGSISLVETSGEAVLDSDGPTVE